MKIMGSLPNLHELSSGYVDVDIQNDLFIQAFKKKGIVVDWSKNKRDHKSTLHTRNLNSNANSYIADVQLLNKFNYEVSIIC